MENFEKFHGRENRTSTRKILLHLTQTNKNKNDTSNKTYRSTESEDIIQLSIKVMKRSENFFVDIFFGDTLYQKVDQGFQYDST